MKKEGLPVSNVSLTCIVAQSALMLSSNTADNDIRRQRALSRRR